MTPVCRQPAPPPAPLREGRGRPRRDSRAARAWRSKRPLGEAKMVRTRTYGPERCTESTVRQREPVVRRRTTRSGVGPVPTEPADYLRPERWRLSMRWQIRRAGWGRPPPPSTWPPAWPRRAAGRCSSTSTRSATRPSRSASPKDLEPNTYTCLLGDGVAIADAAVPDRDRPAAVVPRPPTSPARRSSCRAWTRSEQRLREALAAGRATASTRSSSTARRRSARCR